MTTVNKELRQHILNTIPRLLTQLDRDQLSPTFGCFDRNFWHYKIRDFPSFVLQQNTLSLTLLYKNNFPGNFCYKNPEILSYIKGSINFWCKYQNKSGGVDEYWPGENSFAALVFSFFAVIKSCRELDLWNKDTLFHLDKAYEKWLKHEELEASNQEAAGLAAICEYSLIKQDAVISKRFNDRLNRFLLRQSKEGWFPEHGGADIGYSSVLLHYLAEIFENNKSPKIARAVGRLIDFLYYFIHPDGSVGGEYGSRNTEYFLLGGLAYAFKYCHKARQVFSEIKRDLYTFDDRYLFHYTFFSYLVSYFIIKKEKSIKFTFEKKSYYKKYFPESGFLLIRQKKYFLITNLKKGGVYVLYVDRKLVSKDAGYRVLVDKNTFWVTGWINDDARVNINPDYTKINIETYLYQNRFFTANPVKHICLRIVSVLLPSNSITVILKKLLIFQNKKTSIIFKREFLINKNTIEIIDHFKNLPKILTVYRLTEGSIRLVPSSRFFNKEIINFSEQLFKKIPKTQCPITRFIITIK